MDRTAVVHKNRLLDQYLDQVPIILDYNIQYKKIKDYTAPLAYTADRHLQK